MKARINLICGIISLLVILMALIFYRDENILTLLVVLFINLFSVILNFTAYYILNKKQEDGE